MRLTPSQAQRAFVPLIVLTMSGVINLVLTAVHSGMGPDFPSIWLRQWAVSFSIGLPAALVFVPLIRSGLARITVPSSSHSPSPQQGDEPMIRASADTCDSRLSVELS